MFGEKNLELLSATCGTLHESNGLLLLAFLVCKLRPFCSNFNTEMRASLFRLAQGVLRL